MNTRIVIAAGVTLALVVALYASLDEESRDALWDAVACFVVLLGFVAGVLGFISLWAWAL